MFVGHICKIMEVYINDMLLKSVKVENYHQHINKMLKRYMMKLNLNKCVFIILSKVYMVNHRDIEANLNNIHAIFKMA